jgi:hypothetical protein
MKDGVMYSAASLAPDSAVDVVQRQVNAFNAHNLESLAASYADDVKLYDFPDQLRATGRSALRAYFEKQIGIDPRDHWEIRKRLAAGEVVIDEVRWTGRADGKKLEGVNIYQVRNGLIQSIRAVVSKPAANAKDG